MYYYFVSIEAQTFGGVGVHYMGPKEKTFIYEVGEPIINDAGLARLREYIRDKHDIKGRDGITSVSESGMRHAGFIQPGVRHKLVSLSFLHYLETPLASQEARTDTNEGRNG